MTRRFDLIVFDWDGTLVDSAQKIVRCMRAAAIDAGLPDPGAAAVRDIIGLGLAEAMRTLFPETDEAQRARLVACYREHFLYRDRTETRFFPGVREGLERLARDGYRLAVATGKARRGLDRALRETATAHLFAATRCCDEAVSKPHPRMLHDILAETGAARERTLMVGDTLFDLEMARNAGVAALAVSWGVQPRRRLLAARPAGCVDSFAELRAWLDGGGPD